MRSDLWDYSLKFMAVRKVRYSTVTLHRVSLRFGVLFLFCFVLFCFWFLGFFFFIYLLGRSGFFQAIVACLFIDEYSFDTSIP